MRGVIIDLSGRVKKTDFAVPYIIREVREKELMLHPGMLSGRIADPDSKIT